MKPLVIPAQPGYTVMFFPRLLARKQNKQLTYPPPSPSPNPSPQPLPQPGLRRSLPVPRRVPPSPEGRAGAAGGTCGTRSEPSGAVPGAQGGVLPPARPGGGGGRGCRAPGGLASSPPLRRQVCRAGHVGFIHRGSVGFGVSAASCPKYKEGSLRQQSPRHSTGRSEP